MFWAKQLPAVATLSRGVMRNGTLVSGSIANGGTFAIALRQKRWSGRERYGFSDMGAPVLLAGEHTILPKSGDLATTPLVSEAAQKPGLFLTMVLTLLDRRVIASLRDKKLRRPGAGPRIAVVGNCQSFGVAYAMKLLNLDATVHRFPVIFKSWINVKTLARALKLYDYVFLQPFPPGLVRGGSSEPVLAELNGVVTYPSLIFTGYHPDL